MFGVAKLWDRLFAQLERIESTANAILHLGERFELLGEKHMSAFDDLVAQVTANTNAESAAAAAFTSLANQLEAANGNQAQITALTNQLKLSAANLGAAVVAGTAAASNPPTVVQPTNQVSATPATPATPVAPAATTTAPSSPATSTTPTEPAIPVVDTTTEPAQATTPASSPATNAST